MNINEYKLRCSIIYIHTVARAYRNSEDLIFEKNVKVGTRMSICLMYMDLTKSTRHIHILYILHVFNNFYVLI